MTTVALIVPKVLNPVPPKRLTFGEGTNIHNHPRLADPHFYKPASIDILIGAEPTMRLFTGRAVIRDRNYIMRDTIFGWVVTGTSDPNSASPTTITTTARSEDIDDLRVDELLKQFWQLETIPEIKKLTSEERLCETHYSATTKRICGCYLVQLPFKEQMQVLGESRSQAVRRLHQLEKRLHNNQNMRLEYNNFMAEYISLGHMTPLTSQDRQRDVSQHFYIPHHAVLKLASTKTKLRVVFDASAKSSSGISLNDNLLVGPTIQADLVTILCRFRSFQIAMTADVAKMYRQVLVNSNDANFQRIVWRFSTSEPETDYKLNTVTYGTASAAYQAIRTLHQIADDERYISQRASESIKTNFYVDDYLGGAETIEAALRLKYDICIMLQNGGMDLRGWISNATELCDAERRVLLLDTEHTSVLGLLWNAQSDTFGFNIQIQTPVQLTKRTFLSISAKVFDPLGFLSPITIVTKILFQRLWTSGIGWDDPVPEEVAKPWRIHVNQLGDLSSIQVKRLLGKSIRTSDLIGFADASEKAYAAVIYMRNSQPNCDGHFDITLVAARTKVAPIKPVTLPKLELCAADLLSKLMRKTASALSIDLGHCYAFSDSQVVLSWLSDNPRRWKTFVANRTTNITDIISAERWNYIKSKHNPADCASRGLEPRQLAEHSLWWNGPAFLASEIYIQSAKPRNTTFAEARKVNATTLSSECINVTSYSNLEHLLRITALCLRFLHNLRCSDVTSRRTGSLKPNELNRALNVWIRKSQSESFSAECKDLQRERHISSNSRLNSLDPFMDADGILRVNGRIENANLPYAETHPIILHRKHQLTKLIVTYEHVENLHASHRLLLTILLRRYWIIGARLVAKQIIHKCLTCLRYRGKVADQKMAPLPAVRVTPSRPFTNSGVDYAGPIMVKSWRGRTAKTYKAYIALFVCLATKAIHLEAVTELTTDCFLAALRRFISRRGCPLNIYSDNGTNFVGASRELNKLFEFIKADKTQHTVSRFLTIKEITWHFIPPAAPHFGGIWEAGVKAVKFHLHRVLGQTSLTFEELYTLLCQVEHCLNMRPLCASSGHTDIDALTPNHFLIGSSGGLLPAMERTDDKRNLLRRWKYIQALYNDLWKRWRDEYIRLLQQRTKWSSATNNLEIGNVVLLKHENTSPAAWPLARIIDVHPGNDGHVRVVTLKTQHGIIKRPVTKLVCLPTDIDSGRTDS